MRFEPLPASATRFFLSCALLLALAAWIGNVHAEPRSDAAWSNQEDYLRAWLERDGFVLGTRMHLRVYKESRELEVHLFRGGRYEHFRTLRICAISGDLGPKLREGDLQAPEGVYRITPDAMHPRSDYHLAFNLGFPNQHDRNIGATGSNIMIHGGCASVGCFAMTDYYMEQLWVLAGAAFQNGQDAIDVHVLPFRFNERNVLRHSGSEHWPFWASLQPLDRYFDEHGWPARVAVDEIGYRLVDARAEPSGHDSAAAP